MEYFLNVNIVQVAAGDDHVLALTSLGEVYAWGNGEQNQLGRRLIPRRMDASLVPEKTGLRNIVRIGCGAFHSFAVSKEGFVYSWGLNNFQQCGLEPDAGRNENIIFYPTIIGHEDIMSGDVQQCVGGNHFSLLRKGNGSVYAFGRSDEHALALPYPVDPNEPPSPALAGQAKSSSVASASTDSTPAFSQPVPPALGAHSGFAMKVPAFAPPGAQSDAGPPAFEQNKPGKEKTAVGTPTRIPALQGVVHVGCGTSHSLAVTDSGHCYAWGVGEHFQLANNEPTDLAQPALVEGQKIANHRAVLAGAGATFSVLLARPRAWDSAGGGGGDGEAMDTDPV
ncbi:MAG: regulator of chromosome condensation 1/beta-lactamase-inhibitor protein II [Olpidium bornovanus]|uniref:Regulator of chromosome condensation 1/beta-lactamase-inhibitor protein II n=1 Tax=Olpidium bornovanus TaxID=278681 RepID=A0A8H7ZT35_9FUNG|nr:MAG: regulator of chromosome condensation 1/beta-lactamase-inhibitor protein II [Olpidium bornovanus]